MKKQLNFYTLLAFSLLIITACGGKTSKKNEKASLEVQNTNNTTTNTNGGQAQENNTTTGSPMITFEAKEFNYGDVKKGTIVKHTFKFKNTGNAPLIIQNATASCGCTVPEWSKEPIMPGESGEIKVEFNTDGKSGIQNKEITVYTNMPNEAAVKVQLTGTVN
ncbi:MAG: DUF1573 domain-containing protein [Cytophagales bacterium]|nr:MAG: DUF1573 domain-containing protein [Cytophagales bacterium]